MKRLLTGNEAIALGAVDAGVKYAGAYPGTPSTEILETLADEHKGELYSEWAPNEKVALEGAIGAAYAGVRAIASMKHVGLNVAADPFFTNAYVGVNAGLVVVTADDPGMHSSQNEQDNRYYAYHANVPMFEPSNSQDAYDMVRAAYELSERFDVPMLLRTTTRVCHSKSIIESRTADTPEYRPFVADPQKYVTVPAVSKGLKLKVIERTKKLQAFSEETPFNFAEYHDTKIGIVASGICFEYAKEVFGENASYFKVGFSYPMPIGKITEFAKSVDKLYVIEENDPIMEREIKAAGIDVLGKDIFPLNDEMLPEVIRAAMLGEKNPTIAVKSDDMPPRPPALCAGCPHRGIFYTLSHKAARRKKLYISGDIGCYSLGYAAPFNGLDTIICMGASISAAHGAQKAFDMNPESDKRAVAVIGDSTFFHTGINSLMNVAYNRSKVIMIILDNRITGMTGHQQNPGSGYNAQGEEANAIDIPLLVKAIGIENVRTINPNHLDEAEDALEWALALDEPSVIISRYPCALKKFSKEDRSEFGDLFVEKYSVEAEKCDGCAKCVRAACPALTYDKKTKKSTIDPNACVGCGICSQVCDRDAIKLSEAAK